MSAIRGLVASMGSAPPATISYISASAHGESSTTSNAFTSCSMGSGSHVLVVFAYGDIASVTPTVSVGGNSATLIVSTTGGGIFIAANPNPGGTDTITVTTSSARARRKIAWYAVNNLISTTATDSWATSSSSAPSHSLNVSAGGIGIAFVSANAAGSDSTAWSGLTENVDGTYGSSNWGFMSCAADAFASASTPTVTATITGASAAMAGASFR